MLFLNNWIPELDERTRDKWCMWKMIKLKTVIRALWWLKVMIAEFSSFFSNLYFPRVTPCGQSHVIFAFSLNFFRSYWIWILWYPPPHRSWWKWLRKSDIVVLLQSTYNFCGTSYILLQVHVWWSLYTLIHIQGFQYIIPKAFLFTV